ncbi:hypothetical protein [Zunongwangia pacifica]|uniref:Uncharacterized protein n=1 Tax=Zunongwangia pacifica TaxID=2911062 RepID=A0A9X2CNR9_9FLAO|nr:hypothetical protein [Zunongwangia pacifica]MCL6220860.1 hypothetical protein [Zunongwangia pacifica]
MNNKCLLLAILAIAFLSCSEDDESYFNEVPENYFVEDQVPTSDYDLKEWQDFIGMPFYVKAVATDTYLAANGLGNNLLLTNFDKDNDNLVFGFSEKDEASKSLILVAVKEMEPVGVKSTNAKDSVLVPVTFAQNDNKLQDTQFWRFLPSDNKNYSFIQNATLGENNTNFVLEATENSVYLALKNETQNQQFQIVPKGDFEIESIAFDIESFEIIGSDWITVGRDTLINTSDEIKETIIIDKYPENFKASFIENNPQILVPIESEEVELRLPDIEVIYDEVTVSKGWNKTIRYAEDSEWKRNVDISEKSDLKIPPHTTFEVSYYINRYKIEVPYQITYSDRSSGANFRKMGIWKTDFYYESNTELKTITE